MDVLLVDDSLGDAFLIAECLKQANPSITLHHAIDGEQGLSFLRKEGAYAQSPTPGLVLLDVNMPRMDGHQVMEELLADERLRHLPVVVLSTSSSDIDVIPMLQRRCNSYVVKPHDLQALEALIRGLCNYWFGLPGLIAPKSR